MAGRSGDRGYDQSWGAVVIDSEHRYLLVKLASGRHWDHSKGHPEGSESPRETARREIQEEGGVKVRFLEGFFEEAQWNLPSGRLKKAGYFLAEKTGNAPTGGPAGEILDLVWLTYDEARERVTYESGKAVLDAAYRFLESSRDR